MPHLRTISFSYASHLTERDNGKFRDLLISREYQALYGDRFTLTATGVEKIANDKTGWRFASSALGVGTGERGDRVILDDPHNIKDGESDVIRNRTVRWFAVSVAVGELLDKPAHVCGVNLQNARRGVNLV